MGLIKIQDIFKLISGLNKRERTALYAATFVIIIMLLDRLVVLPIYSKISSLSEQIKTAETGIVKDLHIIAQKDRILSEVGKYSSYMSREASEEAAVTSLLKEVENLANKSSLYIVDMKPGGVKEDKAGAKRYQVNITCEGQMEQIMDFMYNIENSSALLTVEKYQINPKSKDSSVAQSSMTISKVTLP